MLPNRESSERSWKVSVDEIIAKNYDLKAVNPNRKDESDKRTPNELIELIEQENEKLIEILKILKENLQG